MKYDKSADDVARSWYHVPNWWKSELKLDVRPKGRRDGYAVPRELEAELDRRVAAVSMGVSQVLSGWEAQCSVIVIVVSTGPLRWRSVAHDIQFEWHGRYHEHAFRTH